MPEIVPVLSEVIWDTKADVKAARDTLTKATALVSNKDIERFIPALVAALINPVEEVPSTIQLLSFGSQIRMLEDNKVVYSRLNGTQAVACKDI